MSAAGTTRGTAERTPGAGGIGASDTGSRTSESIGTSALVQPSRALPRAEAPATLLAPRRAVAPIGRAADSKSAGLGFESLLPCHPPSNAACMSPASDDGPDGPEEPEKDGPESNGKENGKEEDEGPP